MCMGWALSSVTISDGAPLCMSCEALLPLLRGTHGTKSFISSCSAGVRVTGRCRESRGWGMWL